MLTQPEMVSKQMQLGGHISNKPPEKEGHWKKEYIHKCPGHSAVRFEPYDEVFWFAPSIYAPGSPMVGLEPTSLLQVHDGSGDAVPSAHDGREQFFLPPHLLFRTRGQHSGVGLSGPQLHAGRLRLL